MSVVERTSLMRVLGLAALAALVLALGHASAAHAEGGFTFVADPTEPSLPAGSFLVDVADLTGNSIPDLIVENQQTDTLGVMLGDGTGGFGPASSIPLAGHPDGVWVADFNDDGHPDLLVPIEAKAEPRDPNLVPDHVQILFGDGTGNFTVGPSIALPERGPVAVGDFTGNGNADVVVAPDGCWGGSNESKYYMLLGDGRGDLTPGPTTTSETGGCAPEVGDFTGNGRDDLVNYSQGHDGKTGHVELLPGEPDGGFGPAVLTAAEGVDLVAGPVDLAGDDPGLILQGLDGTGSFAVLSGNSTGAFTISHTYPTGQSNPFPSFAVGDFDGDGRADIATVGGSGIAVLENNGAGGFSPGPLVAASAATEDDDDAFAADVNGDGRPDLILGRLSSVSVFLNEAVAIEPVVSEPVDTRRRRASLAMSLKLSHGAHRGRRSLGVIGRLRLEQGLATSGAVCGGRVAIRVMSGNRTLARKTVALTTACTFSASLTIGARELRDARGPTVTVSFGGNAYLHGASARRRVQA
jgi:hypothetical protein